MSNEFFVPSGSPSTGSALASSPIRSAFESVEDGFDKLPTMNAHGNEMVSVNSGGTALEATNNTTSRIKLGLVIGNNVQAWDADLDALAALDATTGFLVRAAAATFNRNVLTGTAAEITVTNGNGVAGNATISLPAALTFTGKTVTGGTFNNATITSSAVITATLTNGSWNNPTVTNGTFNNSAVNNATLNAGSWTNPTFTGATFNNITITNAISITGVSSMLSPITNSLGGDVALNNTAVYFDGPSIAQGSSGTWFVSGTVTCVDTSAAAQFDFKLWDGTTVIDSARHFLSVAAGEFTVSLSGYITSPAGNLRISAKDITTTNGVIRFNQTGNSKDSTITALRIA
jgi:hypothetical protein